MQRTFDEFWDYGDPVGTRERFLGVRGAVSADLLPELLTQIGRTHSLERNFAAAHAILDQADVLIDDTLPIAKIRSLLERGRTFNSANEQERACELFAKALALAEQHGADGYAVDAAHMLGIAAEPAKRLDWNLRALALATESADTVAQKWQGSLLNNIGWTYFDQVDYPTAITYFTRCQHYFEAKDDLNRTLIARWSIAKSRRMMGELEAALNAQMAILALRREAGLSVGYTVEEIAECLYGLGKSADAAPYFAQAHAELSQDRWLVANEAARLIRLQKLSSHT